MSILIDSAAIAYASPIVIGKRLAKFAHGDAAAAAEAIQMVTEKWELAISSAMSFATGRSLESVVQTYRRAVEANARRL